MTTYKRQSAWIAAAKKAGATAFSGTTGIKGVGGDHIRAFIPNGATIGFWWINRKRGQIG